MTEITQQQFDPEKFTKESRESWNKVSRHYDERIASKFFNTLAGQLTSWAELKNGEHVLDAACGPGVVSFEAAALVAPQGKVMGIDLSPAMIELCHEKSLRRGITNANFSDHNAENLAAFENETFDAVLSQLGLMLFAQPQKALTEFRRVLKKSGRIALSVQGRPDQMIFTSIVQKTMARHAPWLKAPGAPTLYSFGEAIVLEHALHDAGFTKIETCYFNGIFTFTSFDEYWNTLVAGAGKTKSMLESLTAELQQTIKIEVSSLAQKYETNGRLNLPYELTAVKALRS